MKTLGHNDLMEYDMKSYEISKQFVDVNWGLYCNWIGERIT